MLANADPTRVHIDGPTNEQKIQNFRFLQRYHPNVTACLVMFQRVIDEKGLRPEDTLSNGQLADVLGPFTNDEHVRKAALAMGIHPRPIAYCVNWTMIFSRSLRLSCKARPAGDGSLNYRLTPPRSRRRSG